MPGRHERLVTKILKILDGGPVASQQALAKELGVSMGVVSQALGILESRGIIVREVVPGSVAKSIRLVEARNNLSRALASERHYSVAEVAALVDSGALIVTRNYVIYRRSI
jgi:DNA-binding GntR family transcriptional regulator